MVRDLTAKDFYHDNIVLLSGQSALVVIDKDKQKRGEDPILCAMIGDSDEIQFLHRLHKMDPGNLDIRYMTSETDPNILVGIYDMLDFQTMVKKKLEDVFEFGLEPGEETTFEDQLRYMYDCVLLDGFKTQELTIFNRDPKEYREGYIAPADLFALFYGAIYPIGTFEEFVKVYNEQQTIITFSGDMELDDGNVTRVVVSLFPPEPGEGLAHMLVSLPGANSEDEAHEFLSQFYQIHNPTF